MKGLYIYFDFIRDEERGKHVGVLKKIHSQRECLERNLGGECGLVNLPRALGQNSPLLLPSFLLSTRTFDLSLVTGGRYDYVYIRRIDPACRSVIRMLRALREGNPDAKIVWEIPTYPYDPIYRRTPAGRLKLPIDRLYRARLARYIDRIVTLTPDGELFGCRTLRITNGVDCGAIPACKKTSYDRGSINLIAVAQFGFHHGYERAIEGLRLYRGKNVILHMVGDGDELARYKALAKEYGLEGQVLFYGPLFDGRLSDVFDAADMALCPLACHRINMFLSSALKSREYLCRGLPIVTSTPIDIIPDGFRYCMRVPEDDSPLDIQGIVDFADSVYGGGLPRVAVAAEIRSFAERMCGMDVSMKNVIDFFRGGTE